MRLGATLGAGPNRLLTGALLTLLGVSGLPARAEADSPATEGGTVVMRSRQPIAVHFAAPAEGRLKVRRADVFVHFDEIMQRHTDLAREDVKDSESCQGELHCFVLRSRSEYTPKKAEGDAPDRGKEKVPHLLFLISSIAQEGDEPDRMSALLVDADLALDLYQSANRDKEFWKEDLEARINGEAVVGRAREARVSTPEDVRMFLQRAITEDFRSAFDRFGNWEPFGRIELSLSQSGLEIVVDGVTVGTTRAGVTLIEQVPQGTRRLRLQSPEYEPYETQLVMQPGAVERLEPKLSRAAGMANIGRTATIIGGAALAVVGAAVTVWAIAAADTGVEIICLNRQEGECGSSRFLKFGFDSNAPYGVDPNGGGLLHAPFGYSLAATGATISLGTLFFTEEGDFPWIPIVAGLVVGAASYGISAAADGSSPFEGP